MDLPENPPYPLGRHRGCGGAVELVEYAAVCSRCEAQDWSPNYSNHYDPDLLKKTEKIRDDLEYQEMKDEITRVCYRK